LQDAALLARKWPHNCGIHGIARTEKMRDSTALGRRSMARMGPLGSRALPPGQPWCSAARPHDHPPIRGSDGIRLDRRGTQPEQARCVCSRPDRRRSRAYGSGGRAAGRPVPHLAVSFRSDTGCGGGRLGCRLSSVPAAAVSGCPAAVAGVRSAGSPRASGVRQAAAGVRASGPPVPAGCVDLASRDQHRRASPTCTRCRRKGVAAAGPPPSGHSRPPRPVSGRLRHWTLRTPWLSAAASRTTADVRTVGRCPDGWCPPRTLPQPAGVRGYRNRSPGRRPLAWRRHRGYARASWRWSRSPSWART
jgi:hypothetical protein